MRRLAIHLPSEFKSAQAVEPGAAFLFFPGTALQNRRHTNRWITGLCVALKQEVKMAFYQQETMWLGLDYLNMEKKKQRHINGE